MEAATGNVSEPRIQSIPFESIIHRVDKERIYDQDVAGLIEGAHHAPDESVGQIHGCDSFSRESEVSDAAGVRQRSSRKAKLLVAVQG